MQSWGLSTWAASQAAEFNPESVSLLRCASRAPKPPWLRQRKAELETGGQKYRREALAGDERRLLGMESDTHERAGDLHHEVWAVGIQCSAVEIPGAEEGFFGAPVSVIQSGRKESAEESQGQGSWKVRGGPPCQDKVSRNCRASGLPAFLLTCRRNKRGRPPWRSRRRW